MLHYRCSWGVVINTGEIPMRVRELENTITMLTDLGHIVHVKWGRVDGKKTRTYEVDDTWQLTVKSGNVGRWLKI